MFPPGNSVVVEVAVTVNLVTESVRADAKSVRHCRELLRLVENPRASEILRDLLRYLETRTDAPPLVSVAASAPRSRVAG